MSELNNFRYTLDFIIMPQNATPQFIQECISRKEKKICEFFNHYYNTINHLHFANHPKTFHEEEFTVTNTAVSNTRFILYITLPDEHEGSLMYCTAYAFSYERNFMGIKNIKFFTIEKSDMGTRCIGTMEDGKHMNLGLPTGTVEGDIAAIANINF